MNFPSRKQLGHHGRREVRRSQRSKQPTAVAIDSVTHLAAIGNVTSNDVTVLSLNQTTLRSTRAQRFRFRRESLWTRARQVRATPIQEFLPNPNFLITASLQNQVEALDPTTGVLTPFRVGINPTALAYNFASSTLVTLNQLSQTMTVVDYLAPASACGFPGDAFEPIWRGHPSADEPGRGGGFDEQPGVAAAVAAVGARRRNRACNRNSGAGISPVTARRWRGRAAMPGLESRYRSDSG